MFDTESPGMAGKINAYPAPLSQFGVLAGVPPQDPLFTQRIFIV